MAEPEQSSDALVDALVAKLTEMTGHTWQRHGAFDVVVPFAGHKSERCEYYHPTSRSSLRDDPEAYARHIAADFSRYTDLSRYTDPRRTHIADNRQAKPL